MSRAGKSATGGRTATRPLPQYPVGVLRFVTTNTKGETALSRKTYAAGPLTAFLFVSTALAAEAQFPGICLSRDPSPPHPVYNDGTGEITFYWTITYDTNCQEPGFVLNIIPPTGPVTVSYPLGCSVPTIATSNDHHGNYVWAVPALTPPGNYYAQVMYNTDWAVCPQANIPEVEAMVGFQVAGAGRFEICKFNDLNGNGSLDPGEPGLPNWCFQIEKSIGVPADPPYDVPVCTGLDGCTAEIVLPMAPCDAATTTYYIHEVLPNCWERTTPPDDPYELVLGQGPQPSLYFGNWQPGRLQFCKFDDLNGNGSQDAGEPGLPNWQFDISGPYGVTGHLVTGPDGCTEVFKGPPGDYTVHESPPDGDAGCWERTTPSPGLVSDDFTVEDVPISCSENSVTVVTVGNWQPGQLRLCKFNDLNGNGSQDAGEPPLEGWQFDFTGPYGASGQLVTGADGCTDVFKGPPGNYTVVESPPAGDTGCWERTVPDPGPVPDPFDVVVATCSVTEVTVGNWQPGRLQFCKFNDLNGNGSQDAGEPPLEGWRFDFTGPHGVSGYLITNPGGCTDVFKGPPGDYTVVESPPAGDTGCWERTNPGPGLVSQQFVVSVEISCSETDVTVIDVGNWQPGLLRFCKFEDLNGNGGQDADEPPLEHWQFDITGPYGASAHLVTEADGCTTVFTGPAGNYTVVESPPVGDTGCWERTTPDPGPVTDPFDVALPVSCPVGSVTSVLVGNWQPAQLQVIKFQDIDGDAEQDPDESCMEGCCFEITPPGWPTCKVYTDSTGCTPIVKGPAGTWTIEEALEAGWRQTTQGGVSPFAMDLDPCADLDVLVGNQAEEEYRKQCNLPVTLAQEDWHNLATETVGIPGGMIYNKFYRAFADFAFYSIPDTNGVLMVGNKHTISFTPTTAGMKTLVAFLPQTGPYAKPLMDYVNPVTHPAGELAGEVVALTLNVAYNDMRLMPRTPGYDFENFIVNTGLFKGRTVGHVLDVADRILGGDPPSWYGIPSYSALIDVLKSINANYQMSDINSFHDRGYLTAVYGPYGRGGHPPAQNPHVP